MKSRLHILPAFFVAIGLGVAVYALNSFTDVDSAKYKGKTGLHYLVETLDANFALLESGGTIDGMYLTNSTLQGTVEHTGTPVLHMTNGTDNGTCTLSMDADKCDDAGDMGALVKGANGSLAIQSDQASQGTLSTILSIGNTGILTLKNGETIDDSTTDDTVSIASDDASLIVRLYSPNATSGDATLVLQGDAAGDAGDMYGINNDGDGNLNIQSDADSKGTLATKLSMGSTGILTLKSGEYLDNTTTDDTLKIGSDDAALIVNLYTPNQTSGDITLVFTGDKDDDAGDMFAINNDGDGNLNIQSDASLKGTLVTKIGVSKDGLITLPNGEKIDNTSDAAVYVTFDDDSTTLGTLFIRSDNSAANIANDDLLAVIAQAYDDHTNMVEWCEIQFQIKDKTYDSKDSVMNFVVEVADTSRTVLTLGAATVIGSGNETIAINSSDWDIDSTGVMSGISGITCDGAVDFQSTLDVDGATTCTNLTVDVGATVTANSNTVNLIGSTIDLTSAVANGGGTGILTNGVIEACAIGAAVPAAGAFTTLSGSTSVKDNGYQAVLASSANDGGAALKLYMFTTNVTMHAGTVWTQALDFTSAILGAQATSTEAEAEPPCITSIATNEVQVTVTADKNFSLMVLGTY